MNQTGFTLIEIVMVIFIMALAVSMVVPFTVNMVDRNSEQKEIALIIQAIKRLRNQAFADLKSGRIRVEENKLILELDGEVFKEYEFEEEDAVSMDAPITINRNGVSSGGAIFLQRGKDYVLLVEKIRNLTRIQTPDGHDLSGENSEEG
jgi:prepilin-type N-terminal cleavage/methylation domain-containing protein